MKKKEGGKSEGLLREVYLQVMDEESNLLFKSQHDKLIHDILLLYLKLICNEHYEKLTSNV